MVQVLANVRLNDKAILDKILGLGDICETSGTGLIPRQSRYLGCR